MTETRLEVNAVYYCKGSFEKKNLAMGLKELDAKTN
jgi:hypothetical protein